jgi:hypothetical protein
MNKELKIEINEVKICVAKRKPPGDSWFPIENTTLVFNSLTDVLEHIYQKKGNTQFYMDAREGCVYVIETEETVIQPEPVQKYSLYGEY